MGVLGGSFGGGARLWRSRGRDRAITAAAVATVSFLVNARWIWLYRRNQLVDVDEAAYFCTSIIDYLFWAEYGLSGWVHAVWSPSIEAPLTTAFTSVLYSIFGVGPTIGFATALIAGTGCVAAAYLLGRSIASGRVGLTAALLTATCPIIVNYSRSFAFAAPSALFTTLALVALVRSRRFGERGWTIAFGVCLGLMPLTRTMTLAFVPGLVAAALLNALAEPENRPGRLKDLAVAVTLGAAVSLSWYAKNGLLVLHYLIDFGYGAHQKFYLQDHSAAGPSVFFDSARNFLDFLYLPHVVYLAAGALAGVILVARRWAGAGLKATAIRLLRADTAPIAIFLGAGVFAVSSTGNKGTGFIAPLVPAMIALSAAALGRLCEGRALRAAHWTLTAAVIVVAGTPLLDLRPPVSNTWRVDLPIFGSTVVAQGRGRIQLYEEAAGLGKKDAPVDLDDPKVAAWLGFSGQTARALDRIIGDRGTAVYGFRNALFNYNTVNLAELLERRKFFINRRVDPLDTGDSVEGYAAWIEREVGDCAALLTSDGEGADLAAPVTRAFMNEAVARSGLVAALTMEAPDGGKVVIWRRADRPAACL